jgi:hypothetical protein
MNRFPCLIRTSTPCGEARYALGDPLVDSYLAFVAGRSRPNTLRAVAHDLKTFFTVIDKDLHWEIHPAGRGTPAIDPTPTADRLCAATKR